MFTQVDSLTNICSDGWFSEGLAQPPTYHFKWELIEFLLRIPPWKLTAGTEKVTRLKRSIIFHPPPFSDSELHPWKLTWTNNWRKRKQVEDVYLPILEMVDSSQPPSLGVQKPPHHADRCVAASVGRRMWGSRWTRGRFWAPCSKTPACRWLGRWELRWLLNRGGELVVLVRMFQGDVVGIGLCVWTWKICVAVYFAYLNQSI